MAQSQSQTAREQLVSVRETVESIWIAIILAFVLRAFVLEAFVIPTGSMAPRLMGQHWQFDCPSCGYHYAFGIPSGGGLPPDISVKLSGPPARCPNCQFDRLFTQGGEYAFSGDRVLVLKYLYRFADPQPWDVVVFKNPQDNEQNYIKRLIGLPGQMIQIVHGDIFYRQLEQDLDGDRVIDEADFKDGRADQLAPWTILRKSPKTQQVMWQVVFDNDYQPDPGLWEKGQSRPWVFPWQSAKPDSRWDTHAQGNRVFHCKAGQEGEELHFQADRERFMPIYAYNQPNPRMYDPDHEINNDLELSFMFVPRSPQAGVGLHLSSFQDHFYAWVSADGECKLLHGQQRPNGRIAMDEKPWLFDKLPGPMELGKGYQVALMHVDHALRLLIEGKVVLETNGSELYPAQIEQMIQQAQQRVPEPKVGIVAGQGEFELRHVALNADVYYTNTFTIDQGGNNTNLRGHATTGNPIVLRKFLDQPDLDEFFVLGDNSPSSRDSRMWGFHAASMRPGYRDGTVPRYNLIGRAFFVYWPGGYRLPLPGLDKLPIVPNVGRMRRIR